MHSNAGLLRFTQRNFDEALTDFEAAAAADPSDAAAVNNIAVSELFTTQVRFDHCNRTVSPQPAVPRFPAPKAQMQVRSEGHHIVGLLTGLAMLTSLCMCTPQAHAAVQGLQAAVRERPQDLLTEGCATTLSRLYELGPPAGVATAKRRLAEFAASAGPEGVHAISVDA